MEYSFIAAVAIHLTAFCHHDEKPRFIQGRQSATRMAPLNFSCQSRRPCGGSH